MAERELIVIGKGNFKDSGCKLHPSCLDCPTHPSECPTLNDKLSRNLGIAKRKEEARKRRRDAFLGSLAAELPLSGTWTAERRQTWLNALAAIVDLFVEAEK